MPSPQKILIVEDEAGIANTIQYALEADGFSSLWASTAQEAMELFKEQCPTFVILDIGLPDMHGFELFRRLQALPGGAQIPMLFLTARSDEIDRVAGLELGADDYIAKPFSPRELVARVRSIVRRFEKLKTSAGGAAATPSTHDGGNTKTSASAATNPTTAKQWTNKATPFEHDEQKMSIRFYGRPLDLSRYEYRLLRLLVQRPGRVFEREELLTLVWDQGSDSFDRTVDAHIKTLRSKLKLIAPDVEAIRTVRGIGYALNDDCPCDARGASFEES